jgi:hypothetical protein
MVRGMEKNSCAVAKARWPSLSEARVRVSESRVHVGLAESAYPIEVQTSVGTAHPTVYIGAARLAGRTGAGILANSATEVANSATEDGAVG